jgi:integrase
MVKSNSAELYLKSYIALIKKANTDDPQQLLNYIASQDLKDRTKHNYLNAIVSLHKHNPSLVKGDVAIIKKERDRLQREINKAVKADNITDKQRAVMDKIDWADIEALLEKLKKQKDDSKEALEDYILLALMNPPLRNDLQEVRVSHSRQDCKDNCILVPKAKGQTTLYIRDHKTTSRGGKPIIRKLDEGLARDVKELVADGRSHLFVDRKGQPFTSSAFTHKLNKLFLKHLQQPISSTLLRKLYLTSKYGDVKKRMNAMKADADQMGHSVQTQQTNYVDGEN